MKHCRIQQINICVGIVESKECHHGRRDAEPIKGPTNTELRQESMGMI